VDLRTRRIFRLSLTTALALAVAYGFGLVLGFIAPLFAFLLTLKPSPPIRFKATITLLLLVVLTTGMGLLLVPMLMHMPLLAVIVVAGSLYLSFFMTVHMQQPFVGLFVALGFTLISAAGLYDFALGKALVESLIGGIVIAVACQWLVYPLFPEDGLSPQAPAVKTTGDREQSNWVAIRGTLIVLPVYLLALNNPSLYIAALMKSFSLGQQTSLVDADRAGRELLGSTFLGGCFAALFWAGLGVLPNLWMFFLWTWLFGIYVAAKIYGAIPGRYPMSYWLNVMTTMLILIGPAVLDIDSGKNLYQAFFVRLSLFVFITLYAWWMMSLLDHLRRRRHRAGAFSPGSGQG